MLYGFFGRVTAAPQLRDALDVSSQRTRLIADRVAKASLQGADGFSLPAVQGTPGTTLEGPVDLESEMVSLADEQLRFEATSRLLQKAYQKVRASLKP
jgi:hypothetical protein